MNNGGAAIAKMGMGNIPVDVVLPIRREIVVDDEGNLLDIDAPGEQVGGDEDARGARPKLPHDNITLLLVHVAVLKSL